MLLRHFARLLEPHWLSGFRYPASLKSLAVRPSLSIFTAAKGHCLNSGLIILPTRLTEACIHSLAPNIRVTDGHLPPHVLAGSHVYQKLVFRTLFKCHFLPPDSIHFSAHVHYSPDHSQQLSTSITSSFYQASISLQYTSRTMTRAPRRLAKSDRSGPVAVLPNNTQTTLSYPSTPPCPYHQSMLQLKFVPETLTDMHPMDRFIAAPSSHHPVAFTEAFKIGTAASDGCTCISATTVTLEIPSEITMVDVDVLRAPHQEQAMLEVGHRP